MTQKHLIFLNFQLNKSKHKCLWILCPFAYCLNVDNSLLFQVSPLHVWLLFSSVWFGCLEILQKLWNESRCIYDWFSVGLCGLIGNYTFLVSLLEVNMAYIGIIIKHFVSTYVCVCFSCTSVLWRCFPQILDFFPSVLVCYLNLFSLFFFMTFKLRYITVAFISYIEGFDLVLQKLPFCPYFDISELLFQMKGILVVTIGIFLPLISTGKSMFNITALLINMQCHNTVGKTIIQYTHTASVQLHFSILDIYNTTSICYDL